MTTPDRVDPALEPLVTLAVADLVDRLGLDGPGQVEVEVAETVTWPDAGIGCRRPGLGYKQVPVDGCRIVLHCDGVPYAYHSGGRARVPFWCPRPD